MFFNDRLLWDVAREQHQDRQRAAEAARLRRRLAQDDSLSPKFSERLVWFTGDLLVLVGTKLQSLSPDPLTVEPACCQCIV